MEMTQVLDTVGSLVAQLKTYSAKVPTVVFLQAVPGGLKPTPEAVDAFEETISRFRRQATASHYRRLTEILVETLEAFETGAVLSAVQDLLMALDQVERMERELASKMGTSDETRLKEYRVALHKILPGKDPELKGAGRGME